ncbi:MAG: hypothetical protein OXH92_21655 [Bryobacterales bacterium]|nr:hypothetical protein [Bryobacterales bacterium]
MLTALAGAALAVLAREGEPDGTGWRYRTETGDGRAFDIGCDGPDLPAAVPAETIVPSAIPQDPKWRGAYRLTVAPPLIALDLCWTPGEPLRIMTFSRGDWEDALLAMARG